jgi:hypothetical protein
LAGARTGAGIKGIERFTPMNELPVPPTASAARQAVEIARVWIVDGRQHVTLNAKAWKDPAAWGLLLVDLAKHLANAYEQVDGRDADVTLARIKEGFDAEWLHATDEPSGRVG